jgi:predicted lipid-binding transport protein (Tim44 family)
MIMIMTIGLIATDAQAARFGGGKSFGMSRVAGTNHSFYNPGNNNARTFSTANSVKSTASKWLGPLAGFAAGGLLASLFMGHGFGSGILSWLLLGGAAFFLWRFISRRLQPTAQQVQAAPFTAPFQAQPVNEPYNPSYINAPSSSAAVQFDEAGFLRHAKSVFIRLQAAYDAANLHDIREFTAPAVFAEVQLQLQERGNAPNQTEVVTLNAELQDVAVEGDETIATVLFSGLIREELGKEPASMKEIWHFSQDNRQNWLVSGIQQLS